jgi:hypothetical protein
MERMVCPACGVEVEDEGLCFSCWDREIEEEVVRPIWKDEDFYAREKLRNRDYYHRNAAWIREKRMRRYDKQIGVRHTHRDAFNYHEGCGRCEVLKGVRVQ